MKADRIRPSVESDWPGIEALLVEADLPLDGAREALGSFYVIDRQGTTGACAALELYGNVWLLRSVAVSQDLRGTGLGTQLVRHLLASINPEQQVVLVTTTAAEWFRSFGFRPVRSDEVPPAVTESVEFRGACPSSATIMMRTGK